MSDNSIHISNDKVENPFPGLRPFGLDESHLFFGREGQSEEVLEHISKNKFVAVIGASGSGKSSLLYCGVIPVLYGGFITDVGSHWKIISTRPGNDPIHNLAVSLSDDSNNISDINILESVLRRNSFGIEEIISQINRDKKENYLIIVDQFEELFRFKNSREKKALNDSEGYVNLLIQAVKQSKLPIYLVITMRSDFIGDCSQFTGLTSLINQSNYLVPQMTRDDMKKAIEGPVAVGGASIEKQLVQELLNDIGDNPDQLPILQHALMRTWNYWQENSDITDPLSITDYEEVGKMEKALSNHANEAFDELKENQKVLCESVFKALTQKGSDNRGVRRPTKVGSLAGIVNCSVKDIISICNVFRKEGRSFLTPSFTNELDENSVVDISHESLMRIWERLRIWVEDEANSVQLYTRLSDASEMFQMGKTGLWRPPDLDLANNWREKHNPTVEWAERHNPAFERSMVFLESSTEAFKDEEENKIRLQKRQLRRTRNFSIVLGIAFILSLVAVVVALDQKNNADKQTRVALEQRKNAENSREQAEIQKEEAQRQTGIAKNALETAEEQRQIAETQKEISDRERNRAEVNEREALRQTDIATKNYKEAEIQRKIAADKSLEAYKRRILAIAQSMAVKSEQIDNDINLQALLAYQAFMFVERYDNSEYYPDIYLGLYNARKSIHNGQNRSLKGHSDAIQSLIFIPNSDYLISAGADGKLIKWNTNNKTNLLIEQNESVNQVLAISNDGTMLACGTDGMGIHVYNLKNENDPRKDLSAHENKIRYLKFSNDNKSLYSSGIDNSIIKWNTNTWENEKIIQHNTHINCIEISKDEKSIYAGTKSGQVISWNRNNNNAFNVVAGNENIAIWSIALSNNNKLLACGDVKGNLRLYNTETFEEVDNLRGHNARIQEIKFRSDDKMIGSVSMDGTVRLWDGNNLKNQPIVLNDHEGFVFAIAFSLDNSTVVTGSTDEDRIIVRPTKASSLANEICANISRNLTLEEWNTFVGSDIDYEKTCDIINKK